MKDKYIIEQQEETQIQIWFSLPPLFYNFIFQAVIIFFRDPIKLPTAN